jgi:hypothetical protein
MKAKELDNLINEILEEETKKLIMEQIDDIDHLVDSVKSFPTLSGLIDKITNIEDVGINNPKIAIFINNVKPEDLIECCGGSSFGEAQKNLMQGLHHDLEDNGFGNNFDIDIDSNGDENSLQLVIRIEAGKNDFVGDNDMKENTKDTNPTVVDKKDVILGSNEKEEPMEGEGLRKVAKTVGNAAKGLVKANLKYNPLAAGAAEAGRRILGKPESPSASPLQKGISKGLDKLGNEIKEEGVQVGLEEKGDKKWIQKAINPKHKGFCTPMTKATCTPKRKALAKRFKKGIENNESMKKRIVTLNETQMAELLKKIIREAAEPTMDATTEKALSDSARQNADALKAVEKKIKDYLSFKGNDNPEFPNQIGVNSKKSAITATSEEEKEIDDNRGRGPQDLDYGEGEPTKEFQDRIEKALTGDSTMGNSQDAGNAIKTDTGKNMVKSMKRRRELHQKEPLNPRAAVPVDTTEKNKPERPLNEEKEQKKVEKKSEVKPQENPDKSRSSIVEEEIKKMKRMASYNEKTQ